MNDVSMYDRVRTSVVYFFYLRVAYVTGSLAGFALDVLDGPWFLALQDGTSAAESSLENTNNGSISTYYYII